MTLFGVAGLAAAALLLESTLTRLLAVAQFYHFAFLVVSLALLGFGASGSILAVFPELIAHRVDKLIGGCGVAFTLSVVLAYGVVNLLPFDSYSIAWDRRQVFLFAIYYLSLTAPFIFAGLGIGGALAAGYGRSHLVYAANLFGSGLGVALAPVLMWMAGVPGAVLLSGLIGLSVTLSMGSVGKNIWRRILLAGLLIGVGGLIVLTIANLAGSAPLGLSISSYKGLSYAKLYPGSRHTFGRWNAISRIDVMAEAGVRNMPGLSYAYEGSLPRQSGLSIDADSLQPLSLIDPNRFLASEYLPESIAFELRPSAKALILEPGGGLGALQSVAGGAERVVAINPNPLVNTAIALSAPAADIYAHPAVQSSFETARTYLEKDGQKFNIIFLPLTDAYRPVTSGAYSLGESYMLTIESFESMFERLNTDGLLVITRWLQTPPSEELRLIATLAEALERFGVKQSSEAIVAYRGVQTITVLIQPDGWGTGELAKMRVFLEQMRFDLVWAPDIQIGEVNRFNRLAEPVYYQAVHDLFHSENRLRYYADYPYAITPPTDDHPFFFHFFTWKQTPALLAALGKTMQPFGGSGYFILLALLGLVAFLSAILIALPVFIRPRRGERRMADRNPIQPSRGSLGQWRVWFYFASLGFAFLFIEIPLIQRWILLLGHPIYAFTVVVLVLLVFSSLGSLMARRSWLSRRWTLGVLVGVAFVTTWLIPGLSRAILGWPLPWRISAAVLCLAPLGALMGFPFPFGLAWVEERSTRLAAWAWAVNGCASVVASVLAAILALSYGFRVVMYLGVLAYGVALLVLPSERHEGNTAQIRSQ